jgi:hypothetical protein
MSRHIPLGADPRLYQMEPIEEDNVPEKELIKEDMPPFQAQSIPIASKNAWVKPEMMGYLPGGTGKASLPKTPADMKMFQAMAGGYPSPDQVPAEYKKNPPPPPGETAPGKVVDEMRLSGAGRKEDGWKPYRPA